MSLAAAAVKAARKAPQMSIEEMASWNTATRATMRAARAMNGDVPLDVRKTDIKDESPLPDKALPPIEPNVVPRQHVLARQTFVPGPLGRILKPGTYSDRAKPVARVSPSEMLEKAEEAAVMRDDIALVWTNLKSRLDLVMGILIALGIGVATLVLVDIFGK